MSPFASEAQRRALYAKDPKLAAEFEAETPKGAKLPEHVAHPPVHHPPKKKRLWHKKS